MTRRRWSRLRAAGAVIMGKTVTTEYALAIPARPGTRTTAAHPRRLVERFGGGSRSRHGAGRDRLADQRLGDPPAAFCGVVGFKPTHGLISRAGALMLSRTLDHVGMFARSVEDVALLAETLVGFDEEDPDTRPSHAPPWPWLGEPPLPPRFASCGRRPGSTPSR